MNPEILVDSQQALAAACAKRFTAAARAAIAIRGRFACALPGGSVAECFLPALADSVSDWQSIDLFWGDERAVGADDPESNYGLAQRLLPQVLMAGGPRVHRMCGEASDLVESARAYEGDMIRVLGDPPQLDLIILGLGPDGHVCSLFPGHPLLSEREKRVAAILDSPKPPRQRLTFTLRPLEETRAIWLAAFGTTKAAAVRSVLEDPASQAPGARALRLARQALVLLDPPAAGELRHP